MEEEEEEEEKKVASLARAPVRRLRRRDAARAIHFPGLPFIENRHCGQNVNDSDLANSGSRIRAQWTFVWRLRASCEPQPVDTHTRAHGRERAEGIPKSMYTERGREKVECHFYLFCALALLGESKRDGWARAVELSISCNARGAHTRLTDAKATLRERAGLFITMSRECCERLCFWRAAYALFSLRRVRVRRCSRECVRVRSHSWIDDDLLLVPFDCAPANS